MAREFVFTQARAEAGNYVITVNTEEVKGKINSMTFLINAGITFNI